MTLGVRRSVECTRTAPARRSGIWPSGSGGTRTDSGAGRQPDRVPVDNTNGGGPPYGILVRMSGAKMPSPAGPIWRCGKPRLISGAAWSPSATASRYPLAVPTWVRIWSTRYPRSWHGAGVTAVQGPRLRLGWLGSSSKPEHHRRAPAHHRQEARPDLSSERKVIFLGFDIFTRRALCRRVGEPGVRCLAADQSTAAPCPRGPGTRCRHWSGAES